MGPRDFPAVRDVDQRDRPGQRSVDAVPIKPFPVQDLRKIKIYLSLRNVGLSGRHVASDSYLEPPGQHGVYSRNRLHYQDTLPFRDVAGNAHYWRHIPPRGHPVASAVNRLHESLYPLIGHFVYFGRGRMSGAEPRRDRAD